MEPSDSSTKKTQALTSHVAPASNSHTTECKQTCGDGIVCLVFLFPKVYLMKQVLDSDVERGTVPCLSNRADMALRRHLADINRDTHLPSKGGLNNQEFKGCHDLNACVLHSYPAPSSQDDT